jgi:hypothetical protein
MTFLLLCAAGFVVTAYASTVLLYTAFGRPPVGHYKTMNEGGGTSLKILPEYEAALRELDAEFPAARALPEQEAAPLSNELGRSLSSRRTWCRSTSGRKSISWTSVYG